MNVSIDEADEKKFNRYKVIFQINNDVDEKNFIRILIDGYTDLTCTQKSIVNNLKNSIENFNNQK